MPQTYNASQVTRGDRIILPLESEATCGIAIPVIVIVREIADAGDHYLLKIEHFGKFIDYKLEKDITVDFWC